jgi:uncharacterized protein
MREPLPTSRRTRGFKRPEGAMNHDRYDEAYIAGVLGSVKSVAMVGASANINRPSYFVMKYLGGKGYDLKPVNPGLAGQDILGHRVEVIWMQLSVRNDTAAAEAEAAGLKVVMNRCPKIEYGRMSGEIGWAGVNAGMISSRRPVLGAGFQNQVIGRKR